MAKSKIRQEGALIKPTTARPPEMNACAPNNSGRHAASAANFKVEGRLISAALKPLPKQLPIVPKERHIPAHKKKTCAVTFPERLMSMLDYAEEMKAKSDNPDIYCVNWLPKGDAFLIRDPNTCAKTVIPKFFKAAKFSSFARKLYRWGFRQVERMDADASLLPPGAVIFASEHFKRDARHEMAKMRSITAAAEKHRGEKLKTTVEGQRARQNPALIVESSPFTATIRSESHQRSRSLESRQPPKKRAIEKLETQVSHTAQPSALSLYLMQQRKSIDTVTPYASSAVSSYTSPVSERSPLTSATTSNVPNALFQAPPPRNANCYATGRELPVGNFPISNHVPHVNAGYVIQENVYETRQVPITFAANSAAPSLSQHASSLQSIHPNSFHHFQRREVIKLFRLAADAIEKSSQGY